MSTSAVYACFTLTFMLFLFTPTHLTYSLSSTLIGRMIIPETTETLNERRDERLTYQFHSPKVNCPWELRSCKENLDRLTISKSHDSIFVHSSFHSLHAQNLVRSTVYFILQIFFTVFYVHITYHCCTRYKREWDEHFMVYLQFFILNNFVCCFGISAYDYNSVSSNFVTFGNISSNIHFLVEYMANFQMTNTWSLIFIFFLLYDNLIGIHV
uniref:Uncharacterized protein n=1 Tax=Cacopsylla melanoneura TaxID=428564 RepID=A0A8D9E701_9HEMI